VQSVLLVAFSHPVQELWEQVWKADQSQRVRPDDELLRLRWDAFQEGHSVPRLRCPPVGYAVPVEAGSGPGSGLPSGTTGACQLPQADPSAGSAG